MYYGGGKVIINWGRVLSNLTALIEADENPYFDLMSFCNSKNINYRDIIGFIRIGKSITVGDLNVSKELRQALKDNERLAKQLELITKKTLWKLEKLLKLIPKPI